VKAVPAAEAIAIDADAAEVAVPAAVAQEADTVVATLVVVEAEAEGSRSAGSQQHHKKWVVPFLRILRARVGTQTTSSVGICISRPSTWLCHLRSRKTPYAAKNAKAFSPSSRLTESRLSSPANPSRPNDNEMPSWQ
jgi:hypothetical protein